MRKEFIIAIISGIIIGVIVAFGVWRANSALNIQEPAFSEKESQKQEERERLEAQLAIAEPEEDDVITSSPIKVTGIAKPDITLVISAEDKDYIVKTSPDGSFEQEVDLIGGVNEILFAHSENGNATQIKSLRVVYSTEFGEETSE